VQIYDCKPSAADPAVLTWTFREPAAVLYGRGGHAVGIHFRGPTFESFDGSSVTGTLQASAPSPVPGAVAWLLLRAVANQGDGGARRRRLRAAARHPGRGSAGGDVRPGRRQHHRRAIPGPLRLLPGPTPDIPQLEEGGLALLPVFEPGAGGLG
jgi:hypothetical protein